MSEIKKTKEIYSFTIEVEQEVEKTEVKKEGEEEIKVTKKIKENVPHQVIIKQPSRREIEEAEMEYSIEMSKCIKAGIVTKAMLLKKYADSGGVLAEEEAKGLIKLHARVAEIEMDLEKIYMKKKQTKADKDKISKLLEEYAEVRKEALDVETAYSSLFNHTADVKAQNKTILWFMLHTSFYRIGEEDELIPLFKGESFEEKKEDYYKKDEEGHVVFDKVKLKLPSLVSFWYFSENASKEDMKLFDDKLEEGEY